MDTMERYLPSMFIISYIVLVFVYFAIQHLGMLLIEWLHIQSGNEEKSDVLQ